MSQTSLGSSAGQRPSLALRLDRVCTEFEVALRDGGRPRIEDFLGDSAGSDRSALLREMVLLEALYRQRRGERADAGEYEVRFPAEAASIRAAFAEAFQATPSAPAGGLDTTADQPLPGQLAPANTMPRYEASGARIGPYKLLQQIGEGGMGTVWMAEQTEPVRRTVALKVVKLGMDTRQAIARFESERQALAIMNHSNIAKILDAGATPSGQPFFVMELVQGVPITEFCDKNRLPAEARLNLFLNVCQAIQHAHHKGVIHRDVKPTNVLVTLCDGAPVAKVIDFGIAKALAQKLTENTLFTARGQMIGTPAYMSPEQAEMSGLDIDTRSDVYSLGVLLYELLTGTTPLESKRLREAGYAEMQRLIREEEAPRPSTRVSTLGNSAATLAGNRGTDVKRLSHLLAGDLDWIVMKALEKDRNRRYATPERFAEDVERYLRRDVVLARPPTTTYRLRRFVQRNRAAVLTAMTVAAALVVGAGVATWQAVRATHAESAAVASAGLEKKAKEDAEAREAELKAVLLFVEDHVFIAARPKGKSGGLGPDVTLRKAVEAALPFVANSFRDQPLIEARLRMTMGATLQFLSDDRMAADQFQTARVIFTKFRGADHADTLNSMNNLAISYGGLGRYPEALKLREETLAARQRTLGPDHPDTLGSMSSLAISYAVIGRYEDALKLEEEALARNKRILGPAHPKTLMNMTGVGNRYAALRRHTDALKLREETANLARVALGVADPITLTCMSNLATSYAAVGRHAEALELDKNTLALRKEILGPGHADTLASMNNVANRYSALGRHAEALEADRETLALEIATVGADHPDTLGSMLNVAYALVRLNRGAEALPIVDEVLKRAAGRVLDPRFLRSVVGIRLLHFVQIKDTAQCRAAAAMWEDLHRMDAPSLYDAACFRATAAAVASQIPGEDASRLATEDADRAMAWLRQAIGQGFAGIPHLLVDDDLAPLRGRADYADLLWDIADMPAAAK